MYYNIVNNMSNAMARAYDWEEVDGMPRYRWYKYALNSVYDLKNFDEHFDITDRSFPDLKYQYDAVNWVTQNDPEALAYIMSELCEPVYDIVKTTLLQELKALKYYKSCEIVVEHLNTCPAPKERTFRRKKVRILKVIKSLEDVLKQVSDLVNQFRAEERDDFYDADKKDAFGYLLNIRGRARNIEERIDALVWLFKNDVDELKKQLSVTICKEVKDQLITLCTEREEFELCTYLQASIAIYDFPDYLDIPPYNPNFRSPLADKFDDLFGDYDDNDL